MLCPVGKKNEPVVHKDASLEFQIGRAITVQDGRDVCLLSTGNLLPMAMEAAEILGRTGTLPKVASFHTVKPLDEKYLGEVFEQYDVVATIEEHSLVGGFGSAVAEWLADGPPRRAKLLRVGTPDEFLHATGSQAYARVRFGLEASDIAGRIQQCRASHGQNLRISA